jgi:hypothetical protein
MWCKRYYDIGAIDLQIEATTENLKLFKRNYFINRDDDDAIYRITNISLDTESNHDNSLIIGATECKDILNQRIIWNQTIFSGTAENYIRQIINENIISPVITNRVISNLAMKTANGYVDTIDAQSDYETVAETIISICKNYNYGWKITFENNIFYFDLYKGVDRSDSQSIVNPIKFSPEYDNLSSSKYELDTSEYKNAVLIGGEGEGNSQTFASVGDDIAGLDRYETYVEHSSSSNSGEITQDDYIAQLKAKGNEELAKVANVATFDGQVIAESYAYKTDYNLGDVVTVQNEYGITANARIIETIETWDTEGYTLELTFEYDGVEEDTGFITTQTDDILMTENNMRLQIEEYEE